jgi:hypothetical protein
MSCGGCLCKEKTDQCSHKHIFNGIPTAKRQSKVFDLYDGDAPSDADRGTDRCVTCMCTANCKSVKFRILKYFWPILDLNSASNTFGRNGASYIITESIMKLLHGHMHKYRSMHRYRSMHMYCSMHLTQALYIPHFEWNLKPSAKLVHRNLSNRTEI